MGEGRDKMETALFAKTPSLSVSGLSYTYGSQTVFSGVSFLMFPGEIAFLTGENGSGKSTLLRCLAGRTRPCQGTMLLDGAPFDASDRHMRSKVAFVPDVPVFYDDLTAREHLMFVRQANRISHEEDRSDVLMDRFGLTRYADRLPSTFSRGMKTKLGLILAFAAKPRVLLLDEAYAPLDAQACETLSELIAEATAKGSSVVMSVHHAVPLLVPDVRLHLSEGSLEVCRETTGCKVSHGQRLDA